MKLRKFLAAIGVGAALFSFAGLTIYAAPDEEEADIIEDIAIENYEEGFNDGFNEGLDNDNNNNNINTNEGMAENTDNNRPNPRTGNGTAALIAIPMAVAAGMVVSKKFKYQ